MQNLKKNLKKITPRTNMRSEVLLRKANRQNTRSHSWKNSYTTVQKPDTLKIASLWENISTHCRPLLNWSSKVFGPAFFWIYSKISREAVIQLVFASLFAIIIFHFAGLQVFGQNPVTKSARNQSSQYFQLINAKRGNIFIQDMSQNQVDQKRYIPVTTTFNSNNLVYNPKNLSKILKSESTLPKIVDLITSNLNLPYNEVRLKLETDLTKEPLAEYSILKKDITEEQKNILDKLGDNLENDKLLTAIDIHLEDREVRLYPENKLLASTIGYAPKSPVIRSDALKTNCRQSVIENEKRGTFRSFDGSVENSEYYVGYYGFEQKYCDILAGLNGKRFPGTGTSGQNIEVVNGANIYTTIDKNLQIKAEQVLEDTMKRNTNENGIPKDGTIVVLQARTGKVLALASSPVFDPNKYNEASPESFRNIAVLDYEVGSVMKPLTIAAALNEYQSGSVGTKGQRLGIPANFAFEDYDTNGKIYRENNGNKLVISNAQNKSYGYLGKVGTNECITWSINTCIADIVDSLGNKKLKEIFESKFIFNTPTALQLPGENGGNLQALENDINCQYCYAQDGFGQGPLISPIQLMRAYTSLTNDGYLVEPYLVDSIKYPDGTEDVGKNQASSIYRAQHPTPVLTSQSAQQVTNGMILMVNTKGAGGTMAQVPGYTIAGKTGTAEVNRPYNNQQCSYACNRNHGIYDQTFIGFNAKSSDPILILVKLSEPKRGQVVNFAGAALGQSFSDMMKYTLDYMGIKEGI
jgi:cell division protein FtsI/penicillin-binding protein 2